MSSMTSGCSPRAAFRYAMSSGSPGLASSQSRPLVDFHERNWSTLSWLTLRPSTRVSIIRSDGKAGGSDAAGPGLGSERSLAGHHPGREDGERKQERAHEPVRAGILAVEDRVPVPATLVEVRLAAGPAEDVEHHQQPPETGDPGKDQQQPRLRSHPPPPV